MLPKIIFTLLLVTTLSITPAFAETLDLKASGLNIHHAIIYESTGIEIESHSVDLDFISIVFEVSVLESTNEMTMTFERSIFDAKNGDEDDEFFILADGEEIEFIEEKNDNTRTLSFSLPQGTEEFEIIGTILLGTSFLQDLAEKDAAKQAEEAEIEAEEEQAAYDMRQEFLMNSCAEGTVYTSEQGCIVVEEELPDTGPLINSIFAAMGIGLAVMIIVWGIGRTRHKKLSVEESNS